MRRLELQSLIFPKKHWTLSMARKWLRDHGYATSVDIKPNVYRFRQDDPRRFFQSSMRTVHWGKNIMATMGHRRILW